MPRNVRGVNRGVQDAQEIRKIREEERRKRKKKTKTWLSMIGLTLIEFLLCIICFAFAYVYYHQVQKYRNDNMIRHSISTVRYILLPPCPLAVSSVFLSLTYLDLISWKSIRPITYFAWIMVSTAGFLCFFLYAGVILMTNSSFTSIIAIIFAIITGLVFLADLICMLISMKRFPAPYWVLKRKFDKMDQCVCTGDIALIDVHERPLCRCGDHWGAPCTCDCPDKTCGCGAEKTGEPPCDCCECAAQVLMQEEPEEIYEIEEDPPQSIHRHSIGSQSYRKSFYDEDYESGVIGEKRKSSVANEAYLDLFDATPVHDFGSHPQPGMYCIDTLRDAAVGPSRASLRGSIKAEMRRKSSVRTPSQIAVAKSLQSPSHRLSTNRGSIGSSSGPHATRISMNSARLNPTRVSATQSARRSQMAYSVYETSVDNKELIKPPVRFYENKDVKKIFNKSSSDEEMGNGDVPVKKIVVAEVDYNPPQKTKSLKPRLKYTASSFPSENEPQIMTLPGQTLDIQDNQLLHRRSSKSVSAREQSSKRPCSLETESETRSKSSTAKRQLSRNVSTTVRPAVRTLSKVIEADNESKGQQSGSDGFPSECTITINK